jgi:hypothetical protein
MPRGPRPWAGLPTTFCGYFWIVFLGEVLLHAVFMVPSMLAYDWYYYGKVVYYVPGRGYELHLIDSHWNEEFGKATLPRYYCDPQEDLLCGKLLNSMISR